MKAVSVQAPAAKALVAALLHQASHPAHCHNIQNLPAVLAAALVGKVCQAARHQYLKAPLAIQVAAAVFSHAAQVNQFLLQASVLRMLLHHIVHQAAAHLRYHFHQVAQAAAGLKAHPTAAPPAAAHLKVPVLAVPHVAAGLNWDTFQVLHLPVTLQAKYREVLHPAVYRHQNLVRAVHPHLKAKVLAV